LPSIDPRLIENSLGKAGLAPAFLLFAAQIPFKTFDRRHPRCARELIEAFDGPACAGQAPGRLFRFRRAKIARIPQMFPILLTWYRDTAARGMIPGIWRAGAAWRDDS
jgi:hypothetical protein